MKQIGRQILAWSLALSYTVQVTAGVAAKADAKPVLSDMYAQKWNSVASKWDNTSERSIRKQMQTLEAQFNPEFKKTDESYFVVFASQIVEFPQITKTKDGAVLALKSDPTKKIEVVSLGDNKFKINGKDYSYNPEVNLQENIEALDYILNFESAEKVSFLDSLFMPKAEALPAWAWGLIAAVVVFVGINIYKNWDKFSGGVKKAHNGMHQAGEAAVGAK